METPRQRVYSFSSNETILEIYKSSPPSSAGLPEHDTTPVWKLSAKGLIAPLGHDARSRERDRDNFKQRVNLREQGQSSGVVEEDDEEGNDSEESINWDEDSEEEERRERRRRRKAPDGQSAFPQTLGFWFDSWIAQIGARAVNIDLQALCAGMQLWREKNEVPRASMYQVRLTVPQQQSPSSSPTALCAKTLRDEDGSYASQSDWDELLREMKALAKDLHQGRKRRDEMRKKIAGWCRQGANEWVKERGEFVEEWEVGYEIERDVDGEKRVVKLGCRRKVAVVENMDLDEDKGDARVGAENNVPAPDREALQDSQDGPSRGNSGDADAMMTGTSNPS